ncbi:hypothetical protein H6758_01610 [Candidatus Nomurabacteria bacterium]|nr:hypothetical protein [Candidatus Nomurabacteria bacterium]
MPKPGIEHTTITCTECHGTGKVTGLTLVTLSAHDFEFASRCQWEIQAQRPEIRELGRLIMSGIPLSWIFLFPTLLYGFYVSRDGWAHLSWWMHLLGIIGSILTAYFGLSSILFLNEYLKLIRESELFHKGLRNLLSTKYGIRLEEEGKTWKHVYRLNGGGPPLPKRNIVTRKQALEQIQEDLAKEKIP